MEQPGSVLPMSVSDSGQVQVEVQFICDDGSTLNEPSQVQDMVLQHPDEQVMPQILPTEETQEVIQLSGSSPYVLYTDPDGLPPEEIRENVFVEDVDIISHTAVAVEAQHGQQTLETVCDFLKQRQLADVSLNCQGKVFNAHKLILAAHSKFFHHLFTDNKKSELCSYISLDEMNLTADGVRAIIEFMYTGTLDPKVNDTHLMVTAEKLSVTKAVCELEKRKKEASILESPSKPRTRQRSKKYDEYVTELSPRRKRRKKPENAEPTLEEVQAEICEEKVEEMEKNDLAEGKEADSINVETLQEMIDAVVDVGEEGEMEVKEELIESDDKPKKSKSSRYVKLEDGGYQCVECDFTAPKTKTLHQHLVEKHSGPVQCDLCSKSFKQRRYLAHHKASAHTGSQFICHVCAKMFGTKQLLLRHEKSHGYQCTKCQSTANNAAELKKHYEEHHACDEPYKCSVDDCTFTCLDPLTLETHQRKHDKPKKSILCDICGKEFSSTYALKHHRNSVHSERYNFQCSKCDYTTNTKFGLTSHLARQHHMTLDGTPARPSFQCDSCDFNCFTKAEFKLHVMKHEGLKPHKCPICNFCTNEKGTLTKHMRLHTGEKPYQCDLCHMKFSHPSGIARHRVQHTGVKPYKCEFCQKGFIKKSSLDAHIACHNNTKPLSCHLCSFSTLRRPSLTTHLLKAHDVRTQRPACFRRGKGQEAVRVPIPRAADSQSEEDLVEQGKPEETISYVYEATDAQGTDSATVYAFEGDYAATSEVYAEPAQPQMTLLYNMDGQQFEYAPLVVTSTAK